MDDKAYELFVADVVRGLSFCSKARVFTNRRYPGIRQPGSYEIDVSCEVWVDDALFFLIVVECKNWARPIDRPQVQKLIQTRDAICAHKAAFASPVGYSKEAVEVAKANGVALWVVAEGIFSVSGAGGRAALSICFRISDYLRSLIYMCMEVKAVENPRLIPSSWLDEYRATYVPPSWQPSCRAVTANAYPTYYAGDRCASGYDPIACETIEYSLAAKPETNTVTRTVHSALKGIGGILRRSGLDGPAADVLLSDFAIPMITKGMSALHFDQLVAFDKNVPHSATRLQAPVEWIDKHGRRFFIYKASMDDDSELGLRSNIVWANAAWLLERRFRAPSNCRRVLDAMRMRFGRRLQAGPDPW